MMNREDFERTFAAADFEPSDEELDEEDVKVDNNEQLIIPAVSFISV